jgi:acyl-CoA thioesterase-1
MPAVHPGHTADAPPHSNRRRWLGSLLLGSIAGLGLVASGPSHGQRAALPARARILALGDSLTAGQGASPAQSWPAVLARLSGWQVDNAGRSGDTSSGAARRLETWLARQRYDAILIGIGGNDMLHRVPHATTQAQIRQLLRRARQHTPYVALLPCPLPDLWRASLGHLQDAPFYAELAAAEQVLLLPGVYTEVLNQPQLRADQIHANARGYAEIARHIAALLQQAHWLASRPID